MSIEDRKKAFQMMINEYNRKEEIAQMNEYNSRKETKSINESIQNTIGLPHKVINSNQLYMNWLNGVKESLAYDCIESIYKSAVQENLAVGIADRKYDGLKKNLITSLIKEYKSPDELINAMKYKSDLLSEYALLIEETVDKIKKDSNKDDQSTYVIDTTIKSDFFDKLNMIKPDNVIGTIRTRVSDAIEEFITQNMADKADITDIMKQAQERIDAAKTDEIKESYNVLARKELTKIYNRPKNFLGTMVYNLAESAGHDKKPTGFYKNENGTVDIDKIVESCEVVYSFLETANTIKLINFDEDRMKNLLNDLKKGV